MRLYVLACVALLAVSAGCVDAVLPDLVLPKTLDLTVQVDANLHEEAEPATYDVRITGPNGTVFQDAGALTPGFHRNASILFESAGPYKLEVLAEHPALGSFAESVPWDFRVLCRDATSLQVTITFSDEGLALDTDSVGSKVCF